MSAIRKRHPTGKDLAPNNSDLHKLCSNCAWYRGGKTKAWCYIITDWNQIHPDWIGCIDWQKKDTPK